MSDMVGSSDGTLSRRRIYWRPTPGDHQAAHTIGLIVTLPSALRWHHAHPTRSRRGRCPGLAYSCSSPPLRLIGSSTRPSCRSCTISAGWRARTSRVEYRWAEGNVDRLPALVDEFIRLQVGVHGVGDTPAIHAVQQATTTIPIVTPSMVTPLRGFVTSLAAGQEHHGGRWLFRRVKRSLLELLTEAVPGVTRVAVLVHPANPCRVHAQERRERSAGIRCTGASLGGRAPGEFERAFDAAIPKGAGALLVLAVLFSRN